MTLKEKLLSDMKGAMKSKDSIRLNTIRIVKSEIKNQEINLRRELEDEDIVALISSQIKKRREAAALYEKGDRAELMQQELDEISVLEDYLPEQVSHEEIQKRVEEIIKDLGAQGLKDMGKVMKVIVPEFKGKADNSLIKDMVTKILGN
jgi:uncharacterized protein YqeY